MKEKYTEHLTPFSHITSPLFDRHGVRHFFSRRDGGVSEGVYKSFNFAAGGGEDADKWENVVENHRIAASYFSLETDDICRSNQTHSVNVLEVNGSHKGTGILFPPFEEGVDGLVTKEKGLILTVRGADCVTLLFYDVKNKICGACHSGWRGTAGQIAKKTVEKMCALGAEPCHIIAAVGPSVGGCCYTVGNEVYDTFIKEDSAFKACFDRKDDKLRLNLQKAVEISLVSAGLLPENISDCGECTVCDGGKNYFSHRLCGNRRGTMAAFITI